MHDLQTVVVFWKVEGQDFETDRGRQGMGGDGRKALLCAVVIDVRFVPCLVLCCVSFRQAALHAQSEQCVCRESGGVFV